MVTSGEVLKENTMLLEETKTGRVLIAKVLKNRIAADIAPSLKAALMGLAGSGNSFIVLDLGEVTFIDSSGLGALVAILKVIRQEGDIVLCGARGAVVSMLKLTRMDQVFRMFATTEEAVAALS